MSLVDKARAALAATWTPRTATPAEVAELRRLIGIVLTGSPAEERQEALAIACADIDAALVSFRALANAMQCDKSDLSDKRRTWR